MRAHKILCPVDFSDACADAAVYADGLAARFGGEMTLLHVAPPADFELAMVRPQTSRLLEYTSHRNRIAQQALAHFPEGRPLRRCTNRQVAEGNAAEEILAVSMRDGHDLIVMPTRRDGGLYRWLTVGSVTTKVLMAAEIPAIAGIDFSFRAPLAGSCVICAIDLGPQSPRVLCAGAALAREFQTPLVVVHAAPAFGDAAEDFLDESWRVTLKTRLYEKIGELQQQTSCQGEVLVETGEPHEVVASAASQRGASLVVIGRSSPGGVLGRLRAHSTAIVRRSPCPVLSL